MKSVFAILVSVVGLAACADGGGTGLPTAPAGYRSIPWTPPPGHVIDVAAVVVNKNGICIEGATVQVVGGQGVGERVEQVTPCDAWEWGNGVTIRGVVPGVEMTIHASAPGYADMEMTIVPSFGIQQYAVFRPSRL